MGMTVHPGMGCILQNLPIKTECFELLRRKSVKMPEVNQEYCAVKGSTKVFPECYATMNYSPHMLILDGNATCILISQRENAEMENKIRLGDI